MTTNPTARERTSTIFDAWPLRDFDNWEELADAIEAEIEAAAQAAREEERAPMECPGKHPRACEDSRCYPIACSACAREARAVEEAERRIGELAEDLMQERGRTLSAESRVRRDTFEAIRAKLQPSYSDLPAGHQFRSGILHAINLIDAIERGERDGGERA